jgi:hypothetical protein
LRNAAPALKIGTSFNIVARGATELSLYDFSAEIEMPWAEGEEMSGFVENPAQPGKQPLSKNELGAVLSLAF